MHRYNYRADSNAEYVKEDFVAYTLADSDDEDLSDAKVVEKSKTKIQRRRVGTARGRGGATPEIYPNSTSVRYYNKPQSQLLTTLASSTKTTSVRSTNKHQSQILFISTRKTRTKHIVSSMICRKREITSHDDDIDDDDGGDVDRVANAGCGKAIRQHTCRPKRSCH